MVDPQSTYHLGVSGSFDTLATLFHLHVSNARKELSSASRLRIARHLDLNAGLRILEIGPSSGVTTAASLCALQQDLTLFDLWTHPRQWRLLEKSNPKLKIVLGDADSPFPFGDAKFDACIFMGAIGYMERPLDTLHEVHRILKPGGKLFISNNRKVEKTLIREIGRFDKSIVTRWDQPDLIQALEKTRFQIRETNDYGATPLHFSKFYRNFNKFIYSKGLLYDMIVARHPDKYMFSGAMAVKV